MGLANYYAQHIRHFADIAAPLMHIMSPKRVWTWGVEQECAYEKLHGLLCNPPVFQLPDLQRRFIVNTNACINTMGTVLLQEYNDGLHLVAFHLPKYNPAK